MEPEKLMPGMVVQFGSIELVFLAKMRLKSGLSYLFDNGYTFYGSDLNRLTENADRYGHFFVSDDAMEVLENHNLVIKEVSQLRPGMVILTIEDNYGLCDIRNVAVVDSIHGMAFDRHGEIIKFSGNYVVNTGYEVPVDGLLTEEGRVAIEKMYPE